MKNSGGNFLVRYSILIFFIFLSVFSYSQKEANTWYFGFRTTSDGAGLDFSGGNPIALTNGKLSSSEACTSISDKTTGQLLFYSDGTQVWDRTHTVMANGSGLLGNHSASQGAIVVPDPGNANLFYLFIVDAWAISGSTFVPVSTGGLSYSVIDMTLNTGLGDVTAVKNVQLHQPVTEQLTAVKHCNGIDYWVMVKEMNSNRYFAYLVTAAGVQAPVISSVAPVVSSNQGQLKFSPDGNKLARTNVFLPSSNAYLYDFDKVTGVVSNPIVVSTNEFIYGIEFSPDNEKLYTSTNPYGVYQYQIGCAGVSGKIRIGPRLDASSGFVSPRPTKGLQLGPDGRIYIIRVIGVGKDSMDVILNPNNIGLAANYSENHIHLMGRYTDFGSPGFVQSYFDRSVYKKTLFLGNDTTISGGCHELDAGLIAPCVSYSYLWSTGETTQTIQIDSSGTYWMKTGNCVTDSDTITVIVNPSAGVNVSISSSATTIVNGGSVSLTATPGSTTYQWIPASGVECATCSITEISPSVTTTYTLLTSDINGCAEIDTLTIYVWEEISDTCIAFENIYIPNAFSPNNDGVNDIYKIIGNTSMNIHFIVYDRWGEKVFEATDVSATWDGNFRGKPVDAGVYVYHYKSVCRTNSEESIVKGNISVVR